MKKILFLVDHKHRDFPAHCLIAYYLKKKGHRVYLRRLHEQDVGLIQPDILIENKLGRNPEYLKRINSWRRQKIKIVLIENEGINQFSESKRKVSFKPDYAFFWNKNHGHIIEENFKYEVIGSPRTDFLLNKFRPIFKKKDEIIKNLNLDSNLKTISIAMHNSYEDLSDKKLNQMAKTRSFIYNEKFTFFDLVEHQRRTREGLLNFVNDLIIKGLNYNVILKPHPNDDINFWRDFEKKNPQVKLMIGAPINDLFCVSDLHIGKSGCSTIPESYIYGLPNIEFKPLDKYSKFVVSKDHSNLALFNVSNFNEIELSINDIIQNQIPKKITDHRDQVMKNYISNYFHKIDGKRCLNYSERIDEILTQKEKLNLINIIKNFSFRIFYFMKDFVNKYTRILLSKYYVERLIDKRGRYDSRISLNDEYSYYQKFDNLKFDQHKKEQNI